ncbi:MAG: response regulator [Candidatus Lokiarchaeota archaeon]|nr:response regulator [Candidatus Lokiarchaeota archaeon]
MKVLLIEDNSSDSRLIKEILDESQIEFEIIVCRRLYDGLEAMRKYVFDIILLDLSLPDSDGLETVTHMYDEADCPIIILSGLDNEELAIKSLKMGVQDYLVKDKINKYLLNRSIRYAKERHKNIIERKRMKKKTKKALDRSNFYKDLLAHDMRNILGNMNSTIQLMELKHKSLIQNSDLYEKLDILKEQIEQGIILISNVLKLSNIEKEEQKIRNINIKEILHLGLRNMQSLFRKNNVEIDLEIPDNDLIAVGGDLLIDVFENILKNAIIHNESSKIKIWIKLSETRENGFEFIKVEFQDNGIGIKDVKKADIFVRKHRKKSTRGGFGIGMSLVKRIINTYRGRIWVEDRIKGKYEQGSNFIVLLKRVV